MPNDSNDRPTLSAEERRFVQQFASSYAPAPLSGARQAAFDAALEARLERRRQRWVWGTPMAIAAAAAAFAFWMLPLGPQDPAEVEPAPLVATTTDPREIPAPTAEAAVPPLWEEALLHAQVDDAAELDRDGAEDLGDQVENNLPPDYVAIDGLFFDDEDLFGG